MDITDIIGKGKVYEPPFYADDYGMYIFDKNNQMVLEIRGNGYLQYLFDEVTLYNHVFQSIADHIVELLNERWKDVSSEAFKPVGYETTGGQQKKQDTDLN